MKNETTAKERVSHTPTAFFLVHATKLYLANNRCKFAITTDSCGVFCPACEEHKQTRACQAAQWSQQQTKTPQLPHRSTKSSLPVGRLHDVWKVQTWIARVKSPCLPGARLRLRALSRHSRLFSRLQLVNYPHWPQICELQKLRLVLQLKVSQLPLFAVWFKVGVPSVTNGQQAQTQASRGRDHPPDTLFWPAPQQQTLHSNLHKGSSQTRCCHAKSVPNKSSAAHRVQTTWPQLVGAVQQSRRHQEMQPFLGRAPCAH